MSNIGRNERSVTFVETVKTSNALFVHHGIFWCNIHNLDNHFWNISEWVCTILITVRFDIAFSTTGHLGFEIYPRRSSLDKSTDWRIKQLVQRSVNRVFRKSVIFMFQFRKDCPLCMLHITVLV